MGIQLLTTPERSVLMGHVRQNGTECELEVRGILRKLNVSFESNCRTLPGRPDMCNHADKWVIFVHGCFWHAHPGCVNWSLPKQNSSFWKKKFRDNQARDRSTVDKLCRMGYAVLVLWECHLKNIESAKSEIEYFLYNSMRRISAALNLDKGFLTRQRSPSQRLDWEPVRVADLFSGCGGLSLGAKEACQKLHRRFQSVMALDTNKRALRVYSRNLHCLKKSFGKIEKIVDGEIGKDPSEAEKKFLRSTGQVDLLLSGPPCQGVSDLNNHTRRTDPRNDLYERALRAIEIIRPTHALIENVPMIVHASNNIVARTVRLLSNLGYFTDAGSVDLQCLGLPQRRKRHVVLASLRKKVRVSNVVEKYSLSESRSVWWAIEDLKSEDSSSLFTSSSEQSSRNMKRIEYLFKHDVYDLPNSMRPACHRGGTHTYRSSYGRLRRDLPAQTITTGFGSPGQGRFVHPIKKRTLTPHEAARLQFFPDFFKFNSVRSRRALQEMIGNAAPLLLSYFCSYELLS